MTSLGERGIRHAAVVVVAAFAAATALPAWSITGQSEGFTLPVVDERTGAPLAGVHAIQVVTTAWGVGFESRSNKELAFLREGVSDASGSLSFGPRSFVINPLKAFHQVEGAAVYLFKPGYCFGVRGAYRPTLESLGSSKLTWVNPWHPVIKLRPCPDRLEALRDLTDEVGVAWHLVKYLASDDYGYCGWRNAQQFVVAVETERWRLMHGYRAPMRETPLDIRVYSPFLGKILSEPRALACGRVEELVAQVVVPCPGSGERMQQVSWRSHEQPPLGRGDYSPPVLTGRCPTTGTHWHFQDSRGWESSPKPIPNEWRNWGLPDPPPLHPSRPRG
jgi:hypothetical protein